VTPVHRLLLVLIAILAGGAAHAQYADPVPPSLRLEAGSASKSSLNSVLVFPGATFISNISSGITTRVGGLVSIETSRLLSGWNQENPPRNRVTQLTLGSWLWSDGPSTLYEVHLAARTTRGTGIQVGYLNSDRGNARAYDVFGLYTLVPPKPLPGFWSWHTGLGLFIDPSDRRTTRDFTGFLQGQTRLNSRLTLNASYWYIGDRGNFNRIALGVGFTL
jgi:hypothetical protein